MTTGEQDGEHDTSSIMLKSAVLLPFKSSLTLSSVFNHTKEGGIHMDYSFLTFILSSIDLS